MFQPELPSVPFAIRLLSVMLGHEMLQLQELQVSGVDVDGKPGIILIRRNNGDNNDNNDNDNGNNGNNNIDNIDNNNNSNNNDINKIVV